MIVHEPMNYALRLTPVSYTHLDVYKRQINSIMSPVVQGTAKMLEAETLDMNRYREQKDKLEYEAMMRNPETAYLVSNEEFDKQLDELVFYY